MKIFKLLNNKNDLHVHNNYKNFCRCNVIETIIIFYQIIVVFHFLTKLNILYKKSIKNFHRFYPKFYFEYKEI